MKHNVKVRTAECSCGQVSLICKGEPIRTAICHCFACQKRTGSVFGVQARFTKSQVTYSGDVVEYTRLGDSGNQVSYSFCPACGSTMMLTLSALPDFVVIPIGVFNSQDLPQPSFAVYEEHKHSWLKFACQV
ncbi:GFA family protein [Vibrio panuliri]|uniref:Aldehyde-activating protein n=1 Tax=Vibrio panuliri TaxID=1381081 RepID=A0A1Q9HR27_9VIBR|nr:GFA family protein [Vibrio panuliri]KAB1458218.1 GFA family protein [Vibrio panuliri]OLQ88524.1 aldehyde-activating protein [Vibrio panuliri]OLQ93334.1 aldehyde-activating protein [Vibrio panuliri]